MLLRIRTLGVTVHVLRIDNGSVFLGAEFRAVCDEFGVDIQRTASYRHHQLARIERHWRTISDAVTALLADADLAKGFWGYAFLSVAYARNRVWHSGANCIPFQRVTGAGPDLANLRVFGCPAYVHIESSRRKKLDPKAWKGIFVGYAVDSPVVSIWSITQLPGVLSAHRMLLLMRPGFLPAKRRTPNLGEDAPSGHVMEILSSSSAPHSTHTPEILAPPSSPAS